MRVLILTDESFASRERALLSRMEVGLADDGVRVIHAVPRKAARWHQPEVFSHEITYEARGLAFSRGWRVRQVLHELEELAGAEGRPADVIHAFGRGCWSFASELAGLTGAGLAIELWSAELLGVRPPSGADGHAPIYFVPDAGLERAVRTQDPNLSVRLTPWGVHTPPQPAEILAPGKTVSIVIAGSGEDGPAMAGALEGLAAIAARHAEIMIFADAAAVRTSGAWPVVRQLGLLDRFTLIPDLEARRELALRGDMLLVPEALGQHRSIVLDAMGHGMLVVGVADPLNSCLADGRTARLVDKPKGDGWATALGWALNDPAQARSLAWAGREYVRLNRRASSHVASVVDAYEWMSAGDAIPFGIGA
jgi:hypothetical protein